MNCVFFSFFFYIGKKLIGIIKDMDIFLNYRLDDRKVVFIDCDMSSMKLLKKNIKACHLLNRAFPVYGDVFHVLPKMKLKYERFDVVIADPPFKDGLREKIVRVVSENKLLSPGGYLIIEHDIRDPDSEDHPMTVEKQRHFGHCAVSIYI